MALFPLNGAAISWRRRLGDSTDYSVTGGVCTHFVWGGSISCVSSGTAAVLYRHQYGRAVSLRPNLYADTGCPLCSGAFEPAGRQATDASK